MCLVAMNGENVYPAMRYVLRGSEKPVHDVHDLAHRAGIAKNALFVMVPGEGDVCVEVWRGEYLQDVVTVLGTDEEAVVNEKLRRLAATHSVLVVVGEPGLDEELDAFVRDARRAVLLFGCPLSKDVQLFTSLLRSEQNMDDGLRGLPSATFDSMFGYILCVRLAVNPTKVQLNTLCGHAVAGQAWDGNPVGPPAVVNNIIFAGHGETEPEGFALVDGVFTPADLEAVLRTVEVNNTGWLFANHCFSTCWPVVARDRPHTFRNLNPMAFSKGTTPLEEGDFGKIVGVVLRRLQLDSATSTAADVIEAALKAELNDCAELTAALTRRREQFQTTWADEARYPPPGAGDAVPPPMFTPCCLRVFPANKGDAAAIMFTSEHGLDVHLFDSGLSWSTFTESAWATVGPALYTGALRSMWVSHVDTDHIHGVEYLLKKHWAAYQLKHGALPPRSLAEMAPFEDTALLMNTPTTAPPAARTAELTRAGASGDYLRIMWGDSRHWQPTRALEPMTLGHTPVNPGSDAGGLRDGIHILNPTATLGPSWPTGLECASTAGGSVTKANTRSVVLGIKSGVGSALLTADAGEVQVLAGLEAAWTASATVDGVHKWFFTYAHVPHHGSKHNVTTAFFQSVVARVYGFSSDASSPHRPHIDVLRAFRDTVVADPGRGVVQALFTYEAGAARFRDLLSAEQAVRFDVAVCPETGYRDINLSGDVAGVSTV